MLQRCCRGSDQAILAIVIFLVKSKVSRDEALAALIFLFGVGRPKASYTAWSSGIPQRILLER